MFRIAALTAALAAGACATPIKRVEPDEFAPHGRFPTTAVREQAFLECRLQAENAGRQMLGSGVPGALPTLYGPPPLVLRAVYDTMRVCMAARGYGWDTPR